MKKLTSSIIFSGAAIGVAGFWVWYFLYMIFRENFGTIFGIPTILLILLGSTIVGGIVSYRNVQRISQGDLSKPSILAHVVIGIIATALSYGLWMVFIPFLVGQ